jgi:Spy/CpxP family protein refolding chaperone
MTGISLIKFALVFAMVLFFNSLAAASPHGGRGGDRDDHSRGDHDLATLNLTYVQRARMEQIKAAVDVQLAGLRQSVEQRRLTLEAMTPDQGGYMTAAEALAQAEANEDKERVIQRARADAQIYAILTSDQQAQLAALKAARVDGVRGLSAPTKTQGVPVPSRQSSQ